MDFRNCLFLGIIFVFIGINTTIFAQSPTNPQLTTMQTAETVGKGGSHTSFGLFQHTIDNVLPPQRQKVIIGGFQELRVVTFEHNTYIVPIRFTYGLNDSLDLQLGATLTTGGANKIVHDFYDSDNPELNAKRVYNQPIYDGLIGLKYNIKPEKNDGLPSISVGGQVYSGFTADDKLNSDNEFGDDSPIDGFPFIGINTYLVGSQRIGKYFKVHAGAGVYLNSKALDTTDLFRLNYQVGGEIAVAGNLWIAGDYSRELQYSGLNIGNIIGLALRYEVTNNLVFQIGLSTLPGIQFNLTLGGEQAKAMEGNKLLF